MTRIDEDFRQLRLILFAKQITLELAKMCLCLGPVVILNKTIDGLCNSNFIVMLMVYEMIWGVGYTETSCDPF